MDGVMSFAQLRMCILDALDFRSQDNTISLAWRIRGPLDVAALRSAVRSLVDRNITLRTKYTVLGGRPTATVDQEPSVDFSIERLVDVGSEEALLERLSSLAHLPYRLSSDAVLRVFLIHVSDDDVVMLITIHHIAADGVSTFVLTDELSEFYSAGVAGRPPELPETKVEYTDYVTWQQEWVRGQEAEQQLSYWRRALAGLEELELPADYPRRPVRSPDGKFVPFTFDRELSDRVVAVSREYRTSVFMFLVAAFMVLLSRYAEQEDIAVGIPVEGRGKREFEEVVGLFVNTVVLRSHARPDLPFSEYLHAVRRASLGAIDNQDVPFERVVQQLRPHRDLSHNPLFEIMFAFDNAGQASLRLEGLQVEDFPVRPRVSQLDLGVEIGVSGAGLIGGQMIYAADLFRSSTIGRLAEHYGRVLSAVTERPHIALGQIELATPAERATVMRQASGPVVPGPGCLAHELFEKRAADAPADTAIGYGPDELSYGCLNGDANQVAHYLRGFSITLESPVGVCLSRGGALVTALLAVLKAGGAYLPLDPGLSDERINRVLADVGASAVITDSVLATRMTVPGIPVIVIDACQSDISRLPRTNPAVNISPDNLAYFSYTSGSTGEPEGVAVPHRALVNTLTWSGKRHSINSDDRVVGYSHISCSASVWEILTPLTSGASLLIPPEGPFSRDLLARYCEKHEATVLRVTPSQLAVMLRHSDLANFDPLRLVVVSGEPLTENMCQKAFSAYDAVIDNGYGSTECAMFAAARWWNENEADDPAIGAPIDNVVARVLDDEMNVVAPGLRGVLHLGGEGLGRGYLRNPRLTAERFVPDPHGPPGTRLHVTGDIVRADKAGVHTFISRSDRQVKLLGRNVRLDEIESAVTALPHVSQSAVVLDGPEGTQRLVCFVTPEANEYVDAGTLKEAMRGILPSYMMPSMFVITREIPSTLSGKTAYARLREMCNTLRSKFK